MPRKQQPANLYGDALEGDGFLTPRQLSDFLGGPDRVSENQLALWRSRGGGPDFHKFGRNVLYLKADVRAWLAKNHFSTTGKQAA